VLRYKQQTIDLTGGKEKMCYGQEEEHGFSQRDASPEVVKATLEGKRFTVDYQGKVFYY
jgi:hypothetical protein